MNAFKARYHAPAPTFSALAYDAVYMVKTAIEQQKSDDSIKVAAGLAKIKDFDGVTGKITVNKTHDPEMPIAIEEMTNGKVSNSFSVE